MRKYIFWILLLFSYPPLHCQSNLPRLDELSIEEKVGQLLMVHFYGTEANGDAKKLIQDFHIGGIIYYEWANGLADAQQVQILSRGLQSLAQERAHPIPLFLAIDQEGGVVNRLKNGFTQFPGNYALGQIKKAGDAEACAYATGLELKSVGINVNLAPVVDVNCNEKNPIIGIRAFGSSPKDVASLGKEMMEGFRKSSILSVLKHFPGHGDVEVDSHQALPCLNKTRGELDQVELYPFHQLLPLSEAVMTSHLFVPALDAKTCITFSCDAVTQVLRKEMGFEGVILTDSLAMQGCLGQSQGVVDAAIQSFKAGHDVLLLGGKQLLGEGGGFEITIDEIAKIHQTLVFLVQTGEISEQRLDASVRRILAAKKIYACQDLALSFDPSIHQQLAQKVADTATEVKYCQLQEKVSLKTQRILLVSPSICQEAIEKSDLVHLAPLTTRYFYDSLSPEKEAFDAGVALAARSDLCVFCTYNAWRYPQQVTFVEALIKEGLPVIVVAGRDPWDQTLFSKASIVICTYSPVCCSFNSAAHLIRQEYQCATTNP
ncbi:uncharacterized lipoprotein ybbD [Parachlamydia acanthamoebae UV-7]|uniref:beta-N-acetylhexosaminidase n=2 Tax=Parachlamydia acanthamoebae TaxID=83552 RepID=F8L275_PARAV|nr:glycoside hydrolase family 3 protein [Parachlamydia acanthamoebae]CCB87409.1 uncharacterized lipoprotein ybbD [Parachlamydia acanthamoebae UV-7]